MKLRVTLLGAIAFCISIARADEAIFAWTYTTDLLPKDRWEFEQWMTARWEKEHGTYNVFDFREELEYGVTDNFQVALYLNHHYVDASDHIPVADPAHPKKLLPGVFETGGEDVHAGYDPATPFDSYHFQSVSFEANYRLLSPYRDPIGLALYFEPAVGDQETELEWKVLLQKNWLEDRFVWALNINYELEFEKEEEGKWRRNRGNGSLFMGAFGILTVGGYGLYYAGAERLRSWTSWIHLGVGLALPLLLILHIWLGKRTRPTAQLQKRPLSVAKLR
jgi:hypothetical protein